MLTESYTYDFAGNRASKTESDGSVTYYVNDVSEELTYVMAEYSEEDSSDVVTYVRGDELLLMERNEEVWYYIQDGHGNTEFLIDEEANVTDRYVYDAYGNLLVSEGDTQNDFLYCGEQYNALTGLYYLRARYMNPATGTFISEDAYAGRMHEPVTLHKYLYAHANPVKYTDPSGYMASYADAAGTAVLVGVLVGGLTIGTGMLRKMLASMMEDLESIKDSLGVWIRYYIHQAAQKSAEDAIISAKKAKKEVENQTSEDDSDAKENENRKFKKPVKGKSGKEKADDVPSWAKGERPYEGESGNEFAERLLNQRYGKGNYDKGPGSDYNKIRKWGDRAFE